MDKNELIEILKDWNFWEKDLSAGIERAAYLQTVEKVLSGQQVLVITGARRSGKSYIMRQIAKWLMEKKQVGRKNILIINFEDPRLTGLSTKLLDQALDVYREKLRPEGDLYVFLDEVQEVPSWEKWARTAQELGKARLTVSGSNAKLLSGELATVLTGRHSDMTVLPLSFTEFLMFRNFGVAKERNIVNENAKIGKLLEEFMEFGSFPLVVLGQNKKNILLSYFDDVISKDLLKRYKIRKAEEIKSLAKFYLSNISSPISFTSSGKFLNMPTQSVERFSQYLEASYLIFFLKRFSYKLKEQEKSHRKVYAVDVGLANTIGFRFSDNFGRLAENIVFLELKRRSYLNPQMEIYYWKSLIHEEVDFVVKENISVKGLIQVCWDIRNMDTKKRETKALLKAMKEFKLEKGTIITQDYEGEEDLDGKKITYFPLKKWLLATN